MSHNRLTRALLTCLVISSLPFLTGAKNHRVGAAPALSVVVQAIDTSGVYLPNAFSPNGDGKNDEFGPYFRQDLTIAAYQIQIFDRWGLQVFTSQDFDRRWDGTYRGAIAEAGTYAYSLVVAFSGESESTPFVKHGNVKLVR
jgi:gliding motility-associated-like protein